ncbi:SDR family NAD(P)-dependent oxidoreductase [Candidatus Sodalis endolongispinus]|uniref:SDR family NAD(P)-dependent oxidoreductase n=1 Tax=Candidatus Sodalis endolongispinus TaxID=2812662 RepID=A0ABS5YDX6_9GAMM|nr:SDR family NAD(P)-dependent oxidoreductase [Candidatus Sodalis endolongispinus]
MSFTTLPPEKASELLQVKCVAPTLLAHAAAPGMIARGHCAIINVAGMLAFGAAPPLGQATGRSIYVAALAHLLSLSLALHEELSPAGLRIQALCPGIVATEFHQRQGMDLSVSADEVVTASLRGLELGEVVCAPGVAQSSLLEEDLQASLAAFVGQSSQLAARYR